MRAQLLPSLQPAGVQRGTGAGPSAQSHHLQMSANRLRPQLRRGPRRLYRFPDVSGVAQSSLEVLSIAKYKFVTCGVLEYESMYFGFELERSFAQIRFGALNRNGGESCCSRFSSKFAHGFSDTSSNKPCDF